MFTFQREKLLQCSDSRFTAESEIRKVKGSRLHNLSGTTTHWLLNLMLEYWNVNKHPLQVTFPPVWGFWQLYHPLLLMNSQAKKHTGLKKDANKGETKWKSFRAKYYNSSSGAQLALGSTWNHSPDKHQPTLPGQTCISFNHKPNSGLRAGGQIMLVFNSVNLKQSKCRQVSSLFTTW